MATSTVENYVKRIYIEQQRPGVELVALGKLAAAMGVVPGTVTTMVKTLADSGLARYEPRSGVRLTSAGEHLALHVLRRHRLVELFLMRFLDFDWAEVHDEAEELEHAISDRMLERMDKVLGHPTVDPHGDPIPTAAGEIAVPDVLPLSECEAGQRVTVNRFDNQNPEFLRWLEEHGLTPGAQVKVVKVDAFADALSIEVAGRKQTLGTSSAASILVTR